jgi:hypothetical protein
MHNPVEARHRKDQGEDEKLILEKREAHVEKITEMDELHDRPHVGLKVRTNISWCIYLG